MVTPARLDELGELWERHPCAFLVVGDRHAFRDPFVHDGDLGAAICVSKGRGHRHLAAKLGICRLEPEDFDHLLNRHKSHEVAMVGVGMRPRLVIPTGTLHVAIAAASNSAR
jgi:hypothetical protein